MVFALFPRRQIRQLEPFDRADLFTSLRLENRIFRDIGHDIKRHSLIVHLEFDEILRVEQVGTVEACFLQDLAYGAIRLEFFAVDLALGEPPRSTRFPSFHEHTSIPSLVEHDRTTYRYSNLVLHETFKRLFVVV